MTGLTNQNRVRQWVRQSQASIFPLLEGQTDRLTDLTDISGGRRITCARAHDPGGPPGSPSGSSVRQFVPVALGKWPVRTSEPAEGSSIGFVNGADLAGFHPLLRSQTDPVAGLVETAGGRAGRSLRRRAPSRRSHRDAGPSRGPTHRNRRQA